MLGAGIWSRVIRIENVSAGSRYPATVYALVFELSGILWFYTDIDGTQSLSTHVGTTAGDKDNLGALLPLIDPGFGRWEFVESRAVLGAKQGRIPNGCFIESVALLRERMESGLAASEPRLLSYYVNLPDGVHGHTILQFRAGANLVLLDPDRPARLVRIKPRRADDPGSCAACIRGDVARARWIPIGEWPPVRSRSPAYCVVSAESRGS